MSRSSKKSFCDASTQTDDGSSALPVTQNFFILPPSAQGQALALQILPRQSSRATCCDDQESDPDYDPDEEEDTEEEDPKAKLKRCYSKEDYQYYEKLPKKQRSKVDKTEETISKIDDVQIPMRFRILESQIDPKLKQLAIQKIDDLSMMYAGSGEYLKLKTWIENLCRLPIGRYKNLPISKTDSIEKISAFMDETRRKFDEIVYGHDEAKDQIVKLLAKWISNPQSKGIVIGIQGPMGTGKTTISNALCETLGLPYGFISLAGINGESIFKGHSYTYEGSRWGRIAEILMGAGCMNPILYFDELDKISTTHHGEEVANFLVHLTDFSQNDKFQDNYFSNINLDMSKCIFIFSYNHESLVNPILKDRMITIRVKGYSDSEKIKLSRGYMLPRVLKEYGFAEGELTFSDDVLRYIVQKVEEEQGVRNMKRGYEEIVGTINYKRLLGEFSEFPLEVTAELVDKFLVTNAKKKDGTSKHMMYI